MRFHEIIGEAASNLPTKYEIDPETDLAMNPPQQWSQSPYLGAVRSKGGKGYMAQIHVPQSVWVQVVDHKQGKWGNAPKSFFNDTGNQRPAMIVDGFADPRQAAWFTQEVLYGGELPPADIIEDYFDERYNAGDGSIWRSIKDHIPQFSGEPLTAQDEEAFFAAQDQKSAENVVKKNTSDYERQMPLKIKKALVDFYSKNRALAKKRLGTDSLNGIDAAADKLIASKGVAFFMTSPGSVKMKDIASLKF